jgi:hypothetical protein
MPIKIFGEDETVICVSGDIAAEFSTEEETHFLSFDDGTLIKAEYIDSVWSFTILSEGTAAFFYRYKEPEEGGAVLESEDNFLWVMFGKDFSSTRFLNGQQ